MLLSDIIVSIYSVPGWWGSADPCSVSMRDMQTPQAPGLKVVSASGRKSEVKFENKSVLREWVSYSHVRRRRTTIFKAKLPRRNESKFQPIVPSIHGNIRKPILMAASSLPPSYPLHSHSHTHRTMWISSFLSHSLYMTKTYQLESTANLYKK